MLAEMCVKTQHIAFKEEIVPIRLLAPVIVAGLLPNFTSLTANRKKPVIAPATKANVLNGIPKILPKLGVGQEAPILLLPQQLEAPVRYVRVGRRCRLGTGRGWCEKQRNCQDGEKSYQGICSTSVRFGSDRMDLRNVAAWELHDGRGSLIGGIGSDQNFDSSRLGLC
jgi:hypothetical protein